MENQTPVETTNPNDVTFYFREPTAKMKETKDRKSIV